MVGWLARKRGIRFTGACRGLNSRSRTGRLAIFQNTSGFHSAPPPGCEKRPGGGGGLEGGAGGGGEGGGGLAKRAEGWAVGGQGKRTAPMAFVWSSFWPEQTTEQV